MRSTLESLRQVLAPNLPEGDGWRLVAQHCEEYAAHRFAPVQRRAFADHSPPADDPAAELRAMAAACLELAAASDLAAGATVH
ncbi:hypothetical protein [Zavarzinia sp. CC-PAN008]|uniref:hypothetical protein n=1 Tax=Zavarzinia sp. CC-PAN008 TaxID=3243332 RepID=UPI003F747665